MQEEIFAFDQLRKVLYPLREQLVRHEVYTYIKTIDDLQIFMEHHVFAVWDFMSLLKALQHHLTCVTLPWIPRNNLLSRRFINEIVLEEESDKDFNNGFISHFELYKAAMIQCGANTSVIDKFLKSIQTGEDIVTALRIANAPKAAQTFVKTTWKIIQSGSVPSIAAAFTLGREELIPDMFRTLVNNIQKKFQGKLNIFESYLERHIHLDEDYHTPMALQMLEEVCNADNIKWEEAEEAAYNTLNARIHLWKGVIEEITIAKVKREGAF